MWELIGAFIGMAGGLFIFILKIFQSIAARHVKNFDNRLVTIDDIIKETLLKIQDVEKQLENHSERINSITRDHSHLEDSLEKLNESMNENSQTLSALRATLTGLQEMIQNIISGNLRIRI